MLHTARFGVPGEGAKRAEGEGFLVLILNKLLKIRGRSIQSECSIWGFRVPIEYKDFNADGFDFAPILLPLSGALLS